MLEISGLLAEEKGGKEDEREKYRFRSREPMAQPPLLLKYMFRWACDLLDSKGFELVGDPKGDRTLLWHHTFVAVAYFHVVDVDVRTPNINPVKPSFVTTSNGRVVKLTVGAFI
jgi:hypothetical protein